MSRLSAGREGSKGIAGKEMKAWMDTLKGHVRPPDLEVVLGEAERT